MVGEVVITPRQKLEDLIRLAELCVDLLRQNEEFYAEVIYFLTNIMHVIKCYRQKNSSIICSNRPLIICN